MNKIQSPTTPRVLHFTPGFRMGGIESLLMSLYRGLDKSSLQFDFIVDTIDDLPEFQEIRSAGGRVFQLGRYLDNPLKYQIKVENILKKYSSEYIALHSHTVSRAFPILLSARYHGIRKLIIHSHTDSLSGSKYNLIAKPLTKLSILTATDYWACSDAAGRFYFQSKPYKVFNNTINTNDFLYSPSQRQTMRRKLNLNDNHLVVGHTGRFTYQKNHKYMLEVFHKLHQIEPLSRLLLVGDGPLISEIKELSTKLGLEDSIIFTGNQANIPAYLSTMDVFFLPSHSEGFCISLLEAQANGLPCLASDVIPKDVQLTPSVDTFSLNSNTNEVSLKLLKSLKLERKNSNSNIHTLINKGYDSQVQASKLLDMYS